MSLPPFSPFWFWIGVFVGSLFWYLLGSFRALVERWRKAAAKRRAARQENRLKHAASEWRRWVAEQVQANHIAAPLFALEEIVQPPRLLPKPPAYLPKDTPRPDDIATVAVPYTPDFPEAATLYRSPTLTWAEALSGGANLLLLAPDGAGKTTALSYLAFQLARQDPQLGKLSALVPLFVHASDLPLPLDEKGEPFQALLAALRKNAPRRLIALLEAQLPAWLKSGKVILLVDGADEMAPRRQPALADFLKRLSQKYRRTRMVVAAAPAFSDGLQSVGLIPIGLALWTREEAAQFLNRWGSKWEEFIAPAMAPEGEIPLEEINPRILNRWILGQKAVFSPLEVALKAWAAYAGDALGSTLAEAVEAYARRLLPTNEEEANLARAALAQVALQLTFSEGDSIDERAAAKGVSEIEQKAEEAVLIAIENEERPKVKVKRLLPALLESGLLMRRGEKIAFVHPIMRAYFIAEALAEGGELSLSKGDWWEGRTTALGFLLGVTKTSALTAAMAEADAEPVHQTALALARAFAIADHFEVEQAEAVKLLASLIANPEHPLNLRARLAIGLALSPAKGIGALFRKLLSHPNFTVRWAAALAVGLRRDSKAVEPLKPLLSDKSRAVQRAAALALAAIGTTPALETVAALLLEGDDEQRRAAAEALANHPAEGYPTLREAAYFEDDLQVRRAAAFGLGRIHAEWALELLKQMSIEDSQWIVRDAAAAMRERAEEPSVFIPQPLKPLHETPWLIEFAAEHGMGVSPGKGALQLLHEALRTGSPPHQEAALDYVPYYPSEPWVNDIYPILTGKVGQLRDAAFFALWLLQIAGAIA